ncbi:hypothetical protein CBS76997_2522 [Aspergillus niger]|nr:hypothetical protein CBS13152_7263 [Aspergillus niger]KAI3048965.1 hypothetical protein CBS76997_2522 [Aspergillus niger]KAI3070923.1 hypothetical protein CBS147353_6633 [Aspergillus niger]
MDMGQSEQRVEMPTAEGSHGDGDASAAEPVTVDDAGQIFEDIDDDEPILWGLDDTVARPDETTVGGMWKIILAIPITAAPEQRSHQEAQTNAQSATPAHPLPSNPASQSGICVRVSRPWHVQYLPCKSQPAEGSARGGLHSGRLGGPEGRLVKLKTDKKPRETDMTDPDTIMDEVVKRITGEVHDELATLHHRPSIRPSVPLAK